MGPRNKPVPPQGMITLKLYQHKGGGALCPAPMRVCDQCRRRRLRCNRERPCASCVKAGEDCSYVSAPETRGRRPRPRRSSSPIPPGATAAATATATATVTATKHSPNPAAGKMSSAMRVGELGGGMSLTNWESMQLEEHVEWHDWPAMPTAGLDWPGSASAPQLDSQEDASPTSISSFINTQLSSSVEIPTAYGPGAWAPPPKPLSTTSSQWLGGAVPTIHLYSASFLPYVEIFFDRLYPVFPVIDRMHVTGLLQSTDPSQPLPAGFYPFLAALSAAVIAQLNVAHTEAAHSPLGALGCASLEAPSAEFFVSQCLQTRHAHDFIEDANEWTVLTSFFLFAYYGNLDQSRSAWYYLRESIAFAQALGLDKSDSYTGLDSKTSQRRRRLFWLLFITERAYSLQHRRRAVLRATIGLPRVFDSDSPKLIFGFVALARVFSTVDDGFMAAWVDQTGPDRGKDPCTVGLLDKSCPSGTVSPSEMNEIQRLDIAVTQQWLRVLTCRLAIRHASRHPLSANRRPAYSPDSQHVVASSRDLLHTISSASMACLEAHGIGMEQKVSDVATCLCDIVMSVGIDRFSTDHFSVSDFLHQFLIFLAGFRNHESRYLAPLARKASMALGSKIRPRQFPEAGRAAGSRGSTRLQAPGDHCARRNDSSHGPVDGDVPALTIF